MAILYDDFERSYSQKNDSDQWLKWGGRGAQPPAPIWAPCNSMSPPDWIYKVLFYVQITPN